MAIRSMRAASLTLLLAVTLAVPATTAGAQSGFPLPANAIDDPALDGSMRRLADAILAQDAPGDPDTLFRLQLVAGRYAEADASIVRLRAAAVARGEDRLQAASDNYQYQIIARALANVSPGQDAGPAFAAAFDQLIAPLDNQTSALALRTMNVEEHGGLSLIIVAPQLKAAVADRLARLGKTASLSRADAIGLLRDYQTYRAYEVIRRYAPALVARDDRRRYTIDPEVRVAAADGTPICAIIVRPLSAPGPLPTLFSFTIYADPLVSLSEARRVASHDYAGVIGYTRGKACGTGAVVPREQDGADAAAVIDWIARQPWSDGRVGMFGGSYAGFTQWAAAKYRPAALKAIMPAVAMAPGINSPAEGGVADGSSYYWPHYTAQGPWLNGEAFDDTRRYRSLFDRWYRTGAAYHDLDQLDGAPNPWFDRWLDHPGLDSYWQSMIPTPAEFARIDIPVLATTGYFDGGMLGSLFYYREHRRARPGAEDYLLFGPYDHGSGNRGTMGLMGEHQRSVNGWPIDPVARIDMGELRFAWYDHLFKHGPKPALLKDRVNFEVMGANTWRHVSSLAEMRGTWRHYFLGAETKPGRFMLGASEPASPAILRVDLADRSDADLLARDAAPGEGVVARPNRIVIESAPFEQGGELSGDFGVDLAFLCNKRDFDLSLEIYEQDAQGKVLPLSSLVQRMSFARDRGVRHLLEPNRVEHLSVSSGRVVGRRIAAGSKLILVMSIPKGPEREINYGSGKPVSDETIADAGSPLEIRFLPDTRFNLGLSN